MSTTRTNDYKCAIGTIHFGLEVPPGMVDALDTLYDASLSAIANGGAALLTTEAKIGFEMLESEKTTRPIPGVIGVGNQQVTATVSLTTNRDVDDDLAGHIVLAFVMRAISEAGTAIALSAHLNYVENRIGRHLGEDQLLIDEFDGIVIILTSHGLMPAVEEDVIADQHVQSSDSPMTATELDETAPRPTGSSFDETACHDQQLGRSYSGPTMRGYTPKDVAAV